MKFLRRGFYIFPTGVLLFVLASALSVPQNVLAVSQVTAVTPELKTNKKLHSAHDHQGPLIAIWPVMGESRLSSHFGKRRHPLRKSQVMHNGIDLAAPRGTAVLAVSAGKVTFSGWRNGYGRTVEVQHADGWMTRYAHAQKLTVKKGDRVLQGQTIAQVGSSGDVTGPHLHLEVWKDENPINPLSLYPEGYAYVMQSL